MWICVALCQCAIYCSRVVEEHFCKRVSIANCEWRVVWWIFFLFHFCCRCCCVINCRYLEGELTEGSGLCSGWRRFFFLFSIFGDRRTFIQMDSCSMLVLMDVTFRQGVNKNWKFAFHIWMSDTRDTSFINHLPSFLPYLYFLCQ